MAMPQQKVERLCAQTGVSEAAARAALEQTGGDLLEAALLLEQAGQTAAVPEGFYSTAASGQQAERQAPPPTQPRGTEYSQKRPVEDGAPASQKKTSHGDWAAFFKKLADVLVHGRWEVWRESKRTVALPLWVMALLLCIRFPLMLAVLAICLLLGCRFRLTGPTFPGRDAVNGFFDGAYALVRDLLGEAKEKHKKQEKRRDR